MSVEDVYVGIKSGENRRGAVWEHREGAMKGGRGHKAGRGSIGIT